MALTDEQRKALRIALGSKGDTGIADEIADIIDAGGNPVAAAVADLGATADLSAVSGTYAIPAEPTGAEVDATVQASVTEIEARLDAVESKVDELMGSMRTAGQLAV